MKNHFTVHGKAKTQTAKESKKMFKELDAIFLNKSQHTQGEWKVDDSTENTISIHSPWSKDITTNNFSTFADYRGALICEMHYNSGVPKKETAIANAQRIVKAVNMHDELIEAMKTLIDSAKGNNEYECDANLQDATEKAEQLLKQASEK